MGAQVCKAAGLSVGELGLGNSCLNYILGKCNFPGCGTKNLFKHVKKSEAKEWQVDALCNKLKDGVTKMTQEKRSKGNDHGRGGYGS